MTREIQQEPVDDYRLVHDPENVQNEEYWTIWNSPQHVIHRTKHLITLLKRMGRDDLIKKVIELSDRNRHDGD